MNVAHMCIELSIACVLHFRYEIIIFQNNDMKGRLTMRKERVIASALAMALALTTVCVPAAKTEAAKKAAIAKKSYQVTVGSSVKVSVKNAKKTAKVTWKTSNKKYARIGKKTTKGNAYAMIKGVKAGKATISAKVKTGKKSVVAKCSVVVKDAVKNETQAPVLVATATPTAAPVATATATVVPGTPSPTAEPTKKPTAKPTKKPTPTPTAKPTAEPVLTNQYKVDLKTVEIVTDGIPGAEAKAAYNEETKTLDLQLDGLSGIIMLNPATDVSNYSYVSVKYIIDGVVDEEGNITEDATDINMYVGDGSLTGNGAGQDAQGWSGEIKLNTYGDKVEVFKVFGSKEYSPSGDGVAKAIKIFNFGSECKMRIKEVAYYMNDTKQAAAPMEASALGDKTITIDGVAGADEGWEDAKVSTFQSKVPLEEITPTDTFATAKFKYDADNFYFFVDVADSSIDKASADNFCRDGIELLFDEDNCKKSGSDSADWTENKDAFHYRFTGLDAKSETKTGLVGETAAIQGGGADGKAKTGIEVKYALTDYGYTIEGKIPFATAKAAGDKISADIIIQDCAGGTRYNEYYLTKTTEAKVYWNNTSADFGEITLK